MYLKIIILRFMNIDNISPDTKMLWVICYEPVMGYNCNISY